MAQYVIEFTNKSDVEQTWDITGYDPSTVEPGYFDAIYEDLTQDTIWELVVTAGNYSCSATLFYSVSSDSFMLNVHSGQWDKSRTVVGNIVEIGCYQGDSPLERNAAKKKGNILVKA